MVTVEKLLNYGEFFSWHSLLFSQDSISVPDYDNPTIIFNYDRNDAMYNNPSGGLIPLKTLESNGGAYITDYAFTYDHVTSDIQWTAPEDGFVYINVNYAYAYASDKDRQTLQNGGTVWYDLMAIVSSKGGGANGCGWWCIFEGNKKVTGVHEQGIDGTDHDLIQVKGGNTLAFGRCWNYMSLPGLVTIMFYPLKRIRTYN